MIKIHGFAKGNGILSDLGSFFQFSAIIYLREIHVFAQNFIDITLDESQTA
jgi:hypothetical protein